MSDFWTTAGAAVGLVAAFMAAMAIGLLVRGRILRGGCHNQPNPDGTSSCGVCGGGGSACKRRGDQRGKPGEASSV